MVHLPQLGPFDALKCEMEAVTVNLRQRANKVSCRLFAFDFAFWRLVWHLVCWQQSWLMHSPPYLGDRIWYALVSCICICKLHAGQIAN